MRTKVAIVFALTMTLLNAYTVIPNQSYGNDDPLQVCDIYLPDSAEGNPMVILVHGGAWHAGDKQNFEHIAIHLVQQGYVVVNINYRLAPEYHYPDIPSDVARAIKWAKINFGTGPGDSSRVAILGGSAGAHLSALIALTPEREWVDTLQDVSIKVDGCIGISGVYDFDLLPPDGDSAVLSFLGDSSYWDDAEPINHVDPTDSTHFLLIHGTKDYLVNWWQSDSLHARLLANGCSSILVHLEGQNHGGPIVGFDSVSAPYVDTFLMNLWSTGIMEKSTWMSSKNSTQCRRLVVNLKRLEVDIDHASLYILELVDPAGRKLKELFRGYLSPGHHTFKLDLNEYPAGYYYLVWKQNNRLGILPLLLLK